MRKRRRENTADWPGAKELPNRPGVIYFFTSLSMRQKHDSVTDKDSARGHDSVELAEHDPVWAEKFQSEKSLLASLFSPAAHQIEHIGSTAIPGLRTKPVIDIAVRLDRIEELKPFLPKLRERGYEYQGEYGLPGREFFIKGNPRQFHLHIVDGASGHWRLWLAFRDILLQDARVRAEYSKLKTGLAETYRHQRAKYTAGKSAFINGALIRRASKSNG